MYSDIILDHYRHPRNAGKLKAPSARVVEYNPLCGDTIHLDIQASKSGLIKDIKFVGEGCALSQASMSLLSEEMKGKSFSQVGKYMIADVISLLHVPISPGRVSCISLGLTALQRALTEIKKTDQKKK